MSIPAKRLWQTVAAQLLLVAVPLYGLAPELSGRATPSVDDAAGGRTTRTDFAGRVTQYAYDLAGRLTRRTYPDGSFHAFGYTATGRRQSMTDARGTTSTAYDVRDRVTSLTYPDGRELRFGYDLGGNRTRLEAHVAGQTLVTSFTYDPLSRLETVTDPDGKVSVHGYDANGNRSQLQQPNGVTTSYAYDRRNRLTSLTATHAVEGTIGSYAYTLTPTGNRTRIVEADGTTRSYGYDALERLTDEHVTTGPTPGSPTRWRNVFTYDAVGNRLHQDKTTGTNVPLPLAYTYDPRDRLLTENELTYGWDVHGNQTSKSGPDGAAYTWDFENRLTRVALANGTLVEHTYDADGTRVRTRTTPATGPPTTIDYLVDPWHQTSAAGRGLVLSQVVAETDETGALTAYHVRGDDLLATLRPNPAPAPGGSVWIARYFHAEGIGTIRALTDEAGEVTDRYAFEAFGTLLDHQGSDLNGYLFAGEPHDPNSGFYYNRARWMQPLLGRFAGADLHPGGLADPISLHRYLYASLDPVRRLDPSGLFTGADIMTALASLANIARIAAPIAFTVYQGLRTALLLSPFVIDRVLTWAEVVGGVLGLLDVAAEGATWLDQATRSLTAKKHEVPEGWSSRGFYFEEVTRPNLGKSFPTIDNLDEEGRFGISQRSHMSEHSNPLVRMDRLVSAIGRDLRELDGIEERPLAGNSVMGWREYDAGAVRIRGLLVIVPETDAAYLSFATGRIAQLARQYQAVVKLVPARGWRPSRR